MYTVEPLVQVHALAGAAPANASPVLVATIAATSTRIRRMLDIVPPSSSLWSGRPHLTDPEGGAVICRLLVSRYGSAMVMPDWVAPAVVCSTVGYCTMAPLYE
ncbi:hypothetical protein GCM10018962_37210 [Dactylosporangium matsuzakiense]|uniref:Uncharacterized protein n=1 Tax=Dactylosporangium matsuzakiense TaxID=53360 RepID=A0A9W6KQG1_9ACTN|nr:hypothetical protein GCM10017581_071350 [Dactylosporangium matsuzakiense]